jgi:hypothetical protein
MSLSYSQEMPKPIQSILDKQFPNWQIRPNHLPNPCDQYGPPNPALKFQYQCDLNSDKIPDYALVIIVGKDSALVEYFVAIVSIHSSYKVFVLDSAAAFDGAGERSLYVIKAGSPTNCFSEDSEVLKYAKAGPNSDEVTFPMDLIEISPLCEADWKEIEIHDYIYINGHFVYFMAAD